MYTQYHHHDAITLCENCYTDSVQTCTASSVASQVELYPHSGSTGTMIYHNPNIDLNVKVFNDSKYKGGSVTCTTAVDLQNVHHSHFKS